MAQDKLHNKDFQIAFKTGSDANKSKFAKECVQGELYLSDGALYIAENTAGSNDSALTKYLPAFGEAAVYNTEAALYKVISPAGYVAYAQDTGRVYISNGSGWAYYNSFQNNYSLSFDGSNDYLDLSSLDSTISSIGTGAVTISMWVKFDNSIPAYSGFLHFGNADAFSDYFYCRYNNGSVEFQSREGASGVSNVLASVSKNVWYHLVFIRSGTTGTLYVNNSSTSVTNAEFGADFSNNTNNFMRVGSNRTNTQAGMVLVDEVAVFNSALSASDVTSIYNSGSPTADISLLNPIGWWRMGDDDGGSGTTITDQGSGGNNGTLQNGPTFSTDTP